jgi:negative regulator of sigma E activity
MKKILTTAFVLSFSVLVFAQNTDTDAVKAVLKKYNSAIESLNVKGTEKLFTTDSKIFESGSSEDSYTHYLEHHLAPEFKGFKSFTFRDYKVDVQVEGA